MSALSDAGANVNSLDHLFSDGLSSPIVLSLPPNTIGGLGGLRRREGQRSDVRLQILGSQCLSENF